VERFESRKKLLTLHVLLIKGGEWDMVTIIFANQHSQ
jgi:hypothetical protein